MARLTKEWDNIRGFDPVNQKFIHLDLDLWLKDHGILDEARKEGKQNRPSANEQRIAGTAERIVAWINRRGRVCRANVSQHLADLERDLVDMENTEELLVLEQKVRELLGTAEIELESTLSKGLQRLHGPEWELREEEKDFAEFRLENHLRRLPDYKHRRSALYYVLGFFVFEAMLNASMLMQVNAFGLLGSSIQMGLIGLANVGMFAWCMGNVARQMAHVSTVRKSLFSALAVVIVLAVVAFNVVVGHFRDSMQAVLGDASADIFSVGSDTFERFAAGMFAFDSFQSAFLALLGFLFFCAAAWKWLDRDDHYPDYGRRHRRLQENKALYLGAYEAAQLDLKCVFDDFQSKLEDTRHRLIAKQNRWREHCVQGRSIVEGFPTNLRQYQDDLAYLLGAYYQANRSARTEPAPAWFSDHIEVDSEILRTPSFSPPKQTSLKSVADRVDEAIGALQSTFRSYMRQFRTVDSVLVGRETLGACAVGNR